MIEKIIFNVFAFTLFALMFLNLIRKNDSNYIYLLVLQFIGIALDFIELIFELKFNLVLKLIIYIISIILPIIILLLEYIKNINFTEILDVNLANIYITMKKNDKAKKRLIDLTKKYPKSIIGHIKLAQIYEKEGDKNKALEEYEQVEDENIEKVEIKIGSLYYECGMKKEAKQVLNDLLKITPSSYEASVTLADLLYKDGEYKEAAQIYISALKYTPADYNLYYYLGITYTMLNDFQKAKENYEKAAQINSELFHAKYSLGQLSLIYGDLDEAMAYFEDCINSEDVESGAYFYLARIAIIKGELDKAINYANIAVEEDYKLYQKIQKDDMFVVIKTKIKKPDNKTEKKKKLNEKEIQTDEHLDEMSKIVGKLNNNDIQMIDNFMKNKEKIREFKEREE